jgi:hypothetical protein
MAVEIYRRNKGKNILKPGYAKWKGCTEGVESKSTAVEMLVSILFKNRQL